MNKRQLKKKVKQAKLKEECGLELTAAQHHFIRNYSKYYYTKRDIETYVNVLDGMQSLADKVIRAMINKIADRFQSFADAFKDEEADM